MNDIYKLDVFSFQTIERSLPDLPDEKVKNLSRDQHLLNPYGKAIATGHDSKRLTAQVAETWIHSRWILLAHTITIAPCQAIYYPKRFRIK